MLLKNITNEEKKRLFSESDLKLDFNKAKNFYPY